MFLNTVGKVCTKGREFGFGFRSGHRVRGSLCKESLLVKKKEVCVDFISKMLKKYCRQYNPDSRQSVRPFCSEALWEVHGDVAHL